MTGGRQTLVLLLAGAVAAATLAVAVWAGRRRRGSPEEFYAAGRLLSPLQNGFAMAGGHMSAALFLGITGLVALRGYDGVLAAAGLLAGWLLVLLLVAEPVRNCGRFTLADAVTARLRERPVRLATGAACVTVCLLCLVAELVAAGTLVALLPGGTESGVRSWTVLGVGALATVHVVCGGMRATTWIQAAKTVLLLGGALALTVLVLARYAGDPAALLSRAAERSGHGPDVLAPALPHGGWAHRLDLVSLGLALVLGTAGLPHVLSRLPTVPTARAARRSVVWSVGLVGCCALMTIPLGLGAAALLGGARLRTGDPTGETALPLLARELGGGAGAGGSALVALTAAVALATVLALVTGATLASSASVAHDLYTSLSSGRRHPEVRVARLAAVGVGAAATGLGLFAQQLSVVALAGLAFAVAASANLPVLLYALFWRRFTTRGAVWAVCAGLLSALALVALSPVVSGAPGALLPGADFAVFPLENPALVSVPLGFLAGWLGTVTSTEPADEAGHAAAEVRALTGAGAA